MESPSKGAAEPSAGNPISKPLTLAAAVATLGVVFGDIGTSPLYALRESFKAAFTHGGEIPVVPVLSLIIWSLILVVTVKYVVLVMAANDEGEGGVMTLVSLSSQAKESESRARKAMIVIGLIAAGLLYGDGIITPAISVLSAMEGLKEANARLQVGVIDPHLLSAAIPWLTILVLIPLFVIQKKGTSKVGAYFGPITLAWFTCIAASGVLSLVENHTVIPALLHAFNPIEGFGLFFRTPGLAFAIIGAVFLAVTGAEALYADMGHFGEKPIRATWHLIVLPALILNYLGQGAWVMSHAADVSDPLFNPFFNMAPNWAQLPLVALATAAAIIASQALISGAFSMTTQAIQLNFLPRMRVEYTSGEESGQVYLPVVNWFLFAGCAFAVLQFRSSEALAGAYGIAVSLTMLATSVLYAEYLRKRKLLGGAAWAFCILASTSADTAEDPTSVRRRIDRVRQRLEAEWNKNDAPDPKLLEALVQSCLLLSALCRHRLELPEDSLLYCNMGRFYLSHLEQFSGEIPAHQVRVLSEITAARKQLGRLSPEEELIFDIAKAHNELAEG